MNISLFVVSFRHYLMFSSMLSTCLVIKLYIDNIYLQVCTAIQPLANCAELVENVRASACKVNHDVMSLVKEPTIRLNAYKIKISWENHRINDF